MLNFGLFLGLLRKLGHSVEMQYTEDPWWKNLRYSKASVQVPHAATDVSNQDDVDGELYGSHFSNVIV